MADIDFTTSLNDKGFQIGLRNIERSAARTAKATESLFKLELLKGAATMIGRSFTGPLREAAKTSHEAAMAVRELDTVFDGFLASLGRDLAPAIRAGVSGLRSLLDWADQTRVALVGVGVAMTEAAFTSATLGDAMQNQRALRAAEAEGARLDGVLADMKKAAPSDRAMWDRVNGGTARLRAEAEKDVAAAFDDQYSGLLRLGQIEQDRVDRHRQLNELLTGLTAVQREASGEAELRGMIDQAAEAQVRAAARAESAARSARERAADAERRAVEGAARALDIDLERGRIDLLRLQGETRLADAITRRLELEQKLADVADNQLLNDQQRVAASAELLRISEESERLRDEADRREMERKLGVGGLGQSLGGEALANVGLADQVFGPPVVRADSAASQAGTVVAKNTTTMVGLLQQVVDRGVPTSGARFQ